MTKFLSFVSLFVLYFNVLSLSQAGSFSDDFREFILEETSKSGQAVMLDAPSQQCMSCHNGNSAKHIFIKNSDSPMQFSKSGSSNHPVGMQYVDYFQQQPHNYKEPTSLNPNIQLVNGQVGCLSCHQLKVQNLASTGVQGGSMSLNKYCESSSDLTVESGADLCAACHKI